MIIRNYPPLLVGSGPFTAYHMAGKITMNRNTINAIANSMSVKRITLRLAFHPYLCNGEKHLREQDHRDHEVIPEAALLELHLPENREEAQDEY